MGLNDDELTFLLSINNIGAVSFEAINRLVSPIDGLPMIAIGDYAFIDDDGSLREALIERGMTPYAWCYSIGHQKENGWGWTLVQSCSSEANDKFNRWIGDRLER
jgi:hypothetical protein